MRIGILTVPFNNNYGGFLQAFALKKVLIDMGHEVIFINRRRNRIKIPLIKYLIFFPYFLIKEKRKKKLDNYLSQNTNIFKQKYLAPITKEYFTKSQLKECLNYNFDAIVVGSDQVWRYKYAKDSVDDFFCNFLDKKRILHIAYAASFGTDEQEYPSDKLEICSKLLKKFSMISVREHDGKKLLINYFGVNEDQVNVVLDPTMLLSVDTYKDLFKDIETPKEKYVFTYILDKNQAKQSYIDNFCKEKKLSEYSISAQTGNINELKPIEPVELWLSRIYHAEYVITDSFHGTVFAILFNKPFFVFGNKTRGTSRFNSLLNTFNLAKHYSESFSSINIDSYFDWGQVNDILYKMQIISKNILYCSLNKRNI